MKECMYKHTQESRGEEENSNGAKKTSTRHPDPKRKRDRHQE
jgi:hypothetical protein